MSKVKIAAVGAVGPKRRGHAGKNPAQIAAVATRPGLSSRRSMKRTLPAIRPEAEGQIVVVVHSVVNREDVVHGQRRKDCGGGQPR